MSESNIELDKLITIQEKIDTAPSANVIENNEEHSVSSDPAVEEFKSTRINNLTVLNDVEKNLTSQLVFEIWHVIHPESVFKKTWNVVIVFLLLYTAVIMPYDFAFIDENNYDSWWWLDNVINSLFIIDIVINCFLAYYDDYGYLIYSHFKILKNYFKTWMIIDILGCIPLEYFISTKSSKGYNKLLRLLRLPRLYKLIKIPKNRNPNENHNKFFMKIRSFFNFKQSISRLLRVFIIVLICVHISACFWAFLPKLSNYGQDTWIYSAGYLNENVYIISLYWCIVTFSTVGYGDITPKNNNEIVFAIFWMIFGICFYSFNIGSLASILNSLENR